MSKFELRLQLICAAMTGILAADENLQSPALISELAREIADRIIHDIHEEDAK